MKNPTLVTAVNDLAAARELAHVGNLSPLEHARRREAALGRALAALAAGHGVRLEQPLCIDSRGEFRIVSIADEDSPGDAKAPYGDAFSALLSRFSPRTGVAPGATLMPENQWCWMNHFSVEKLVIEQAQAMS